MGCSSARNIVRTCLILIAALVAYPSEAVADTTLVWDSNTEPDLAGYRVYYGTASRTYGTPIDVGNVTTYTLNGPPQGVTYYIAVTAYDTALNESGYSNEVSASGTVTETVSTPGAFTGPQNGFTGTPYTFTAGGASSNLGNPLEYQFDWKGDGGVLSPWGSKTQTNSWAAAGTYNLRARARSTNDRAVVSNWSVSFPISIAAAAVSCMLATNPSGLQITVDGATYIALQTFTWLPGSTHTISVPTSQTGVYGTRYAYSSWSDGGAQTHTITVPSSSTTYSANFIPQYSVATSSNPSGGGTVSPSNINWFNSGQSALVSATANAGFFFSNWSGDLSGATNPSSITMNSPKNIVANFLPVGSLSLTPSIGFSTSCNWGGSPSFSSQTYTLQNTGGTPVNWSVSKTQGWVTLSPSSGTLAAGAGTALTVSINSLASTLAPGSYSDTVSLANSTNGNGNTARAVSLTVNVPAPPPSGATARVEIDHTYRGDLVVTVGVGNVNSPSWSTVVSNRSGGSADNVYADVDISGGSGYLPPSTANVWFLKVADQGGGDTGTIRTFRITSQGQSYSSADPPVPVNDFQTSYAYFLEGAPSPMLTVNSMNSSSGVPVTMSPSDNNNQGNGTTSFTRTYNKNTVVTLTAPPTSGANTFQKWQRDGGDFSTSQSVNLTMDANHTVTVVYGAPPPPPPSGGTARVEIDHTYRGDLVVTVGVGNVNSPSWSTVVSNRSGGSADNVYADVDISGGSGYLPPSTANVWFLKVADQGGGDTGTIRTFRITSQGQSYSSADPPVPVNDFQTSYADIHP